MKWTREVAGQWTSDAGYTADKLGRGWHLYYKGTPVAECPTLTACKESAATHAPAYDPDDAPAGKPLIEVLTDAEGEQRPDFNRAPSAGVILTGTTSVPTTAPEPSTTDPRTEPARLKHSMFPGFRARRGKRLEDVVAAWVWAAGCFLYGMTT